MMHDGLTAQLTKRQWVVSLTSLCMERHAFRSELSTKPNWALKHANFDLSTASRDHRKVNLNDLTELQIARIVKAPCFVYSITRASNPQLHFGNPDILI
ncbi:hypothetical protein Tco_1577308 [Tanacetum coccineum]